MGIRAGLTEITSDEFEAIKSGKEPTLSTQKVSSIDKAWYDYYHISDDGIPLKTAITGDYLHPQSSHTLDEFYRGQHDFYAGFASPQLVAQLASALGEISPAELQRAYADHGLDYREWDWSSFETLRSAYIEAASAGRALMILIA